MPVHKDCIRTYLNTVIIIICIEICAIYFIFLSQVYVYLKKKWSKISLFNSFILLYTTYRDRAIFVQGKKIRALKVALLYIYYSFMSRMSQAVVIG